MKKPMVCLLVPIFMLLAGCMDMERVTNIYATAEAAKVAATNVVIQATELALEATDIALHASPTPVPTDTPIPTPTNTPTDTPIPTPTHTPVPPTLTPTPIPPTPTPVTVPGVAWGFTQTILNLSGGCFAALFLFFGAWAVRAGIQRAERKPLHQRATGADYPMPDGAIVSSDKVAGGSITPQRNQHDWLAGLDRILHYLKTREVRPLPEAQKPVPAVELPAKIAAQLAGYVAEQASLAVQAEAARLPQWPKWSSAEGNLTFAPQIGARPTPAHLNAPQTMAKGEVGYGGKDLDMLNSVMNRLGLEPPKPPAGWVVEGEPEIKPE